MTTTESPSLTTTLSCVAPVGSSACVAGATISCFDGPADALVAPCGAGTSTCAADLSGYDAACVGEIIPHPDSCDFASAWSCDASPPACGPGLFAETFAGSGNESATSVAVDAAGNVVIAGNATATDIQIGSLGVHLGSTGGFIAKLDATTQPLWAVGLAGASTTVAAVDPAGGIYAAGTFDGSLDVGGSVLQGNSSHGSVFALKLAPSGSVAWLRRLDESGSATVNAIAVAPSGDVLLAGSYGGAATRISGVDLAKSKDTSGLVVRLDPLDGVAGRVQSLRATGDLTLRGIAADPQDNIFVVGALLTPTACEERPLIGSLPASGGVSWLRDLSFDGVARAVAIGADDGAIVTGSVRGTLKVAGVTTRADGFVTHVTPTGPPLWTRALPDWEGHAVAVDDTGAFVIAGAAPAAGATPLSGHVQKSDDQGRRYYDLSFVPAPLHSGGVASLSVDGLAIAPSVGVLLVGDLRGTATFGAGAMPPTAASTTRLDAWIAALGP
jgi:hypothetical protein